MSVFKVACLKLHVLYRPRSTVGTEHNFIEKMIKNIVSPLDPYTSPEGEIRFRRTDTSASFLAPVLAYPGRSPSPIASSSYIAVCLPGRMHRIITKLLTIPVAGRRGCRPFYPFRLDRLERGIENGSERSGLRVRDRETPAFGRRGRRGWLIGGIRSPSSRGERSGTHEKTRARARRWREGGRGRRGRGEGGGRVREAT